MNDAVNPTYIVVWGGFALAFIFGAVANAHVAGLKDLSRREFWLLGTVAAAVLLMGVWPKPFIDVMHVSVVDLLAHVAKSKIP